MGCWEVRMNILKIFEDLITFVGLETLLKGKEAVTSTGRVLGVVEAVEIDLGKHKAWIIVNSSRESGGILIDVDDISHINDDKIIVSGGRTTWLTPTKSLEDQSYLPVPQSIPLSDTGCS
jgi:sporulation protein YlmC with PRC-barrel domain